MKITDKPDLYDLLYNDVTEDIAMYLELLKDQIKVLEFGCGTGRITIPLAQAGHELEAVDLSPQMLNGLKTKINKDPQMLKNIKPVLGDMVNYKAKHKYEAIIIPLTSFNYLTTEGQQLNCLKNIAQNLTEDGFAIIELLSKKTFTEIEDSNKLKFIKNIIINQDEYYQYYRQTSLDMATREISQQRLFNHINHGKIITKEVVEWSNRFVTINDFQNLVAHTPLIIEAIYGDCQLGAYDENSPDVFVKLRRKI